MKKRIITGLVLILVVGAFVGGIFLSRALASGPLKDFFGHSNPPISGNLIAQEISEISQLAVLRYHYTDTAKSSDTARFRPWRLKEFTVQYSGEIILGFDLRGFKNDDVTIHEESKVINITLPPVEILYHVIDEKNAEVLHQTNLILDPIQVQEVYDFVANRKEFIEEKFVGESLMEEAKETAKKLIKAMVGNFAGIKDKEYAVVIA